MASKFLNRDGLKRVLDHLKIKFAPIDSPKFSGKPTVKTPDYTRSTDGKEIINREYQSGLLTGKKKREDLCIPDWQVRALIWIYALFL